MTLYKNKYRIESTRLPNYDYSGNGCYFVTICTHQKHFYFGNIVNTQMQLSVSINHPLPGGVVKMMIIFFAGNQDFMKI